MKRTQWLTLKHTIFFINRRLRFTVILLILLLNPNTKVKSDLISFACGNIGETAQEHFLGMPQSRFSPSAKSFLCRIYKFVHL